MGRRQRRLEGSFQSSQRDIYASKTRAKHEAKDDDEISAEIVRGYTRAQGYLRNSTMPVGDTYQNVSNGEPIWFELL